MPHPTERVPTVASALIDVLRAWRPAGPDQASLRDDYLALVGGSPATALDRDGDPEHLTASCFVFMPDLTQVLLCFHKKGRFWVQLGGHIETTDASVAAAAFREAREECGIDDLRPLGGGIVDLDRHSLGDGFLRCRVHWDVGFAASAARDAVPSTSDESDDVAWWPVGALPENVPPQFGRRLRGVLARLGE